MSKPVRPIKTIEKRIQSILSQKRTIGQNFNFGEIRKNNRPEKKVRAWTIDNEEPVREVKPNAL
jgi:hypothetical protein